MQRDSDRQPGSPSPSSPWHKPSDDSVDVNIFDAREEKVSVIIPARNEEDNIGVVLEHCLPFADELLVLDGHSTDGTREISESLGARVVSDNGRGKGDAIRVAIKAISGDIAVFIDADHSHRPSDIPRLVAPILNGEFDHVVGSRSKGGSDELHGDLGKFIRMIGSDIITLGINYRFGVRLTDSQNGFRAIRTAVARELDLKEDITTIEQEMTIKTLAKGFKMGEVPTHEYARNFGDSKIKLSRVSFRYIYSWLKYLLLAKR
jgi:glycosyltransferase involved in cell wall biosynthesis